MGVRQSGSLGLYLHLEAPPIFGLTAGPLGQRLVLTSPLGTSSWSTATRVAQVKHEARRHAAAPKRPAAAPLSLPPAVRQFVEMQPLPGGLSAALLEESMAGVSGTVAEKWLTALNDACRQYEINRSLRRMAAFLGHIAHESGSLHKVEEGLYYKDAAALNDMFSAFSTDEEAAAYTRKPEALANKVYAKRNGNGDVASGDGWRFRGRGLIQVTGKANYRACGKDLGIDAVKNPELLAVPKYAALSAGSFWKSHGLNELADAEKYQALSLRINKKLKSFPARENNRKRALNALCRAQLMQMSAVLAHFHH